ncbi:MAG: zinc ribbon domain-containing protein [Solirubrobacterales bacterium]
MVWWIPSEFWAASFSRSKEMSASQAERFLKVVQPYVIIAAFEGTIGIFGAVDYKPEERIRADIRLVDAEGTEYKPRADAEINADLKNLLSIMKPIIANMLGPLGQNLHFFVFPAETEAGARIIKPTEKGHFQVKLGEKEYKWRLPLDSLLPGKVCPNCSEACKGSWSFCPWCGTKLAENPETHKP